MTAHTRSRASQQLGAIYARRIEPKLNAATARVLERRYENLNSRTREAATGEARVIVSMTTHGKRFERVHAALESIARGRLRPLRLILWLDDKGLYEDLTPHLRRLVARGLEIRLTKNFGPFTKYYPAVTELQPWHDGALLVTADDDIIYPRSWLSRLVESSTEYPDTINCHRAHVVGLDSEGVAPYADWQPCWDTEPSILNFPTGVSGVLYPPAMTHALAEAGTAFLAVTPSNDDIWAHVVAVENRIPIRQVRSRSRHFPFLPKSQADGLITTNVMAGRNDQQIAAAYSRQIVDTLKRASAGGLRGAP